ncbi:MAG: molybdopterin-dependent oxidoreductase [Deltaproteobacteria bacterium]|nr:molybdopterin-dependent oxidoreductase [Deltaproteobacteria bacterium]
MCAKAPALSDLYDDPDRLRQPLRRKRSGGWERISWTDAFDQAAEGILAVQRAHGKDAAAIYRGEPVTHNLGASFFGPELVAALGTRNHFSANSLDQFPKQLVSHWMYGNGLLLSVPDVDRTDYMLILGANPIISNGSLMTAPGIGNRLRRIRERGGRTVVVDPVRTRTAELADEHHFIRPGTDTFLLAALCQVVLAENRTRLGALEPLLEGFESLEQIMADFAPERVADRTGMSPEAIRSIAAAFCEAERAVCYGRMGVSTSTFAAAANWLVELLNILTGNLDRPGGALRDGARICATESLRVIEARTSSRWRGE